MKYNKSIFEIQFSITRNNPQKLRYLISILCILVTSCLNQEVCEDLTSVPVRIGFYRTQQDNVSVAHTIDSLTVYGLGKDSLIYDNQKKVGRIELPLNSASDSSAFVLVFPEISDTLWFYYERKPNLTSLECGFVTFYELENITYTDYLINAVETNNPSITNNLDEHIKIYPEITTITK